MSRRLPSTPTVPYRRASEARWEAACAGELPAEALSPRDREDLVRGLCDHGWTDAQISSHTRMSTYTVARIRQRLGLRVNKEGAA